MRNLLTLFLILLGTTNGFSLKITNDTKEKINILIESRELLEHSIDVNENPDLSPYIHYSRFNIEPGKTWENAQTYTDFVRDAKKLYNSQPFTIIVWGSVISPKKRSTHPTDCHIQSEIDDVIFVPGKKKGWLECKDALQRHVPSTIGKKPQ